MYKTLSQAVTEFEKSSELHNLAASSKERQRIMTARLVAAAGLTLPTTRLERSHFDEALNASRMSRARGLTKPQKTLKSSLNAYKSDLRRLGRWLHSRGYTRENLASHIVNVHSTTPAYKRTPITADRASALIAYADSVHPRDGMTALLMLSTGMRESEIIGLHWGDVDTAVGIAKAFRPKLDDWHNAYLTNQLHTRLEEWREYYTNRHGEINAEEWYVVPALAHRSDRPGYFRMNPEWPMVPDHKQNSVGVRVKSWLAAVGETDLRGRASHTLRRTAGNIFYELPEVEIRDVQTFYGHSSVAMTENYLDKDVAQQKVQRRVKGLRF
jgi:integrase